MNINYQKGYLYFSFLLAFAIPLSHAGISLAVVLIILLWLVERNYTDTFIMLKQVPLMIAMGTFFIYISLTLLWSDNLISGLDYIREYAHWIIIPILVVTLKKENITQIITAFLLGMLVSEIAAYGMYFELWIINGRGAEDPSPFMMHIDYSILLATTSILLLNRLLSKHYTIREKLPMALFFITVTGNLFLATGRTGQVAFIVAVVVAGVVHFKSSLKRIFLVILLGISIVVIAYKASPNFNGRVHQAINETKSVLVGSYDSPVGKRIAFWVLSMDMIKDQPLFGFGIGDLRESAKSFLLENEYGFSQHVKEYCGTHHFHNQYLMILVQTGFIGFILLLWIFYSYLKLDIKDTELKNLSIVFITIFAVGFLGEPLWSKQFTMLLFVLFTALFIKASVEDTSTS